MINMCCQGDDFNLTEWIDTLAISASRVFCSSIMEIGNNSNYATANKVYQGVNYLSNKSIQITVDLSGLGSEPYYLRISNNRQERSEAYLLGEGGTAAPSPPKGIRIIK
jgi:hypothetical protein